MFQNCLNMLACIPFKVSFQQKSLPKTAWPEFPKQPSLRNKYLEAPGSNQEKKDKKKLLASTCRCDLRRTASRLSLRSQVIRYEELSDSSIGEIRYLSKRFKTFRQVTKLSWGYLKLALTSGYIVIELRLSI